MNVTRDGPVRLPGMPLLGKLLRRFRAGEDRSPLSGQGYAAAATIDVTSPAFTDGGAIPQKHAEKASVTTCLRHCNGPASPQTPSSWS
jgi:hypothetical protein